MHPPQSFRSLLAKVGKYNAAARGVRLAARTLAVVVTIISVLALLGTLVGVYYARGQLREARKVREENAEAFARQHEAESEESEWANRHERLVSQLTKITPTLTVQPPGVPATLPIPFYFSRCENPRGIADLHCPTERQSNRVLAAYQSTAR